MNFEFTKNLNLVSIVITTFNAEKFIISTLKSLISQGYKNWELIIVDDFSNDNTVKLIKKFLNKNRNYKLIVNKKNFGCNYSRNLAIKLAKGRFLALLDHDDRWLKNKLINQVHFHLSNNCHASCTYYRRINSQGMIGKLVKPKLKITYFDLLFQNNIGFSSVMIDRLLFKDFRMYDHDLSDFPTWLNLIKNGLQFRTIEKDLMRYYYDKSTNSHNKIKIAKQRWDIIKNVENFSTLNTFFFMIVYLIKSIFKYKSL